MKFNFKKISAITGSILLTGMTMGVAAAANYPNPFVVGGAADVAIVYGTGTGVSMLDVIEGGNIQSNLQSYMSGSSGTTDASISGESAALFSSSTKLYLNDTLNTVRTTLTKTNLPTTLKDETFSGNVDATITQKIQIGNWPRITFEKQPTSSDDPTIGLKTSTTNTRPMFNATATFNKPVNFSHADSEGEGITLFGMDFTISSATDTKTIVLLKSAEKLMLTSDAPTTDVTIAGETYTIELISSSDTAATIAVTDSSGNTESKEINEAASKKVNGITIAITTADETNLRLSATVVAGSDKVTLEDGSSVLTGEDDTVVDGTIVEFGTGNPNNLTSLTISFDAPASDKDSINVGESYTDPVFGTIKLDFAGLNIDRDSTARETIEVRNNGDNLMEVVFTEHRGNEATITFAKNGTTFFELMANDENNNITVIEQGIFNVGDYVVVGNEDDGYLLKLESTANSSTSGTSNDRATFVDVFSGETIKTTWNSEGSGNLEVGGQTYTVTMTGNSDVATGDNGCNVTLDYPGSSGEIVIVYPTIETSKGANLAFYEPLTINLSGWDNNPSRSSVNLTEIKFPDGDGYESVTVVAFNMSSMTTTNSSYNFTVDSTVHNLNTSDAGSGNVGEDSFLGQIGKLVYNFTSTGTKNEVKIYLQKPSGGNIDAPALMIWEEKDDNNDYHAQVVILENGDDADDGIGISDVEDSWSNDSSSWESTRKSNNKLQDDISLWGTIATIDTSDSDQSTVVISYPDEQVYGQIYIGAADSTVTAGSTTVSGATQLGDVLVKDSEISSVSSKNLIIIGGSCINSAAANVLGGAYCGASFTESTSVGSGEFLIKGVSDAYTTGKIALVVAGHEAADTVNAAKYVRTQTFDTSKEYKGTSSTSATLVTTETA